MPQARKMLLAGGTFAVALGIGFVMQNGDALAFRFATQDTQPVMAAGVIPVSSSVPVLEVPLEQEAPFVVLPVAAEAPALLNEPAPLAEVEPELALTPEALISGQAPLSCAPQMVATAAPAAIALLDLYAPCHANARLTIHHQGMMFTTVTDSDGAAQLDVPALSEVSVFIAEFADGQGAVTTLVLPEVNDYNRAVLLWQSNAALGIHAREFGAEYGSSGHVWLGANRSASAIENGEGFMIRLGDETMLNPQVAEIYTFPEGAMQDGRVELSVEAEVTPENCGRNIAAQSIQIVPGADPFALDLTMTMPSCDAVGDFVVLTSMFSDLEVASR